MARKSNARKTARRARSRVLHAPKLDAVDALLAASARALSLPIDAAWRASVKRDLRLILMHAALVDQFLLPDDTEPAPVFRA
jgi:hypothetical protein